MLKLSSINRLVVRLAVPSILASITVPFVGIVDLAIAGHIGNAAVMSAVVIGSLIFDLIYWELAFLRVGTAGLTAQAFGRRDNQGMMQPFVQGMATAVAASVSVLVLQWGVLRLALACLDCTPQVAQLASDYFLVRIWAVPAALMLFVMRGWFVGMQNTVFQMAVDLSVNVVNMLGSYLLAVHTPLGFNGIALGTVIAQWSGLAVAAGLMWHRYGHLRPYVNVRESLRWVNMKGFFKLNGDNFVRGTVLQLIYAAFTFFATDFGEVELALSSVIMKILMLFSFFIDGFAFAGEALTGRFIGEGNPGALRQTVRSVFGWGAVIGVVFTVVYLVAGSAMVQLFTTDQAVVDASHGYVFWLCLMPIISCVAFVWDGIFIGATASAPMRNSIIYAAVFFLATYFALKPAIGMQAVYAAYFMHLVARSVYMTFMSRRYIWPKCALV